MKGIDYDFCLEVTTPMINDGRHIVSWLDKNVGKLRVCYHNASAEDKRRLAKLEEARFGERWSMKVEQGHRSCYAVGENWIYWIDSDSSTGREWIEFDDKNDLLIAGLQYNASTGTFS